MSGQAQGWAKRQTAPCKASKALLRLLADYADDDGFAWPSIATMAAESQCTERHVKRLLRALEAAGLVVGCDVIDRATRRTRTRAYWFPIYADRPNERLIAAYERKVGGRVTLASPSEGDAEVPGEGDAEVMGRVTPVSPLEPPLEPAGPNGPTPGERAGEASGFEQVFAAWAAVAPGRLSRPRAVGPWAEACQLVDEADLARWALRYLAEDPDVQRGRAMGLDRWLAERRWEAWQAAPPVAAQLAAAARTPFACAEVRAALVAATTERAVVSYLDPSDWRAADRVIEAKTGSAWDWLRTPKVAPVLERFGVKVEKMGRGA